MNFANVNTKSNNNNNNNNNENDSNNNSNKNSSDFNMRAPLPLFQRYEFPVLAEDPVSKSKARTDPLACNINDDAVLVWNDVIIRRDNYDANGNTTTSLPDASIEDVFQELQTTVAAYNGVAAGVVSDEVDGRDCENLKEHLQHHHHHDHHRHGHRHKVQPFGHEDAVVSRRRLYEQGCDLPLISKLEPSTQQRDKNDSFVNSRSLAFNNSKKMIDNDMNLMDNDFKNNLENKCGGNETETTASENNNINKFRYLVNDEVDFVDSPKGMMNTSEDLVKTENSLVESTTECGDDSGVEKSYIESGDFENVSADLSSFRSSAGSDVFLTDEFNHEKNVGRNKNDCYVDDEAYARTHSESEMESLNKNGSESIHDDSVFVEDGKENDVSAVSNDSRCHPVNRSRRRPYRAKDYHKTKDRSTKNQKRQRSILSSSEKDRVWRDDTSVKVKCANELCKIVLNLAEARKSFKNCHHCLRTYYCCRGCRREDWARHKDQGSCHGSRVSSACKKVISYCNTNPEIKAVLSRLAVRGYLSHGRGCVMLGFPDLESTEEFMEYGFPMLELNPIYVSAKELSESKMYGNVLEKLLETCRSYKPDIKFVLNVGVGLRFNKEDFLSFSWHHQGNQYCYRNQNHEEMDTIGSLGSDLGYGSLSSNLNTSQKSISSFPSTPRNHCSHCFVFDNCSQRSPSSRHKAPILQKFIKLKLSPAHSQQVHEKRFTFEKHFWDEFRTAGPTLILTSIPERSGSDIDQSESRKRELTFINIQRKLRERSVNLRHQYPLVHSHLIAYVTRGVHFPSQVLFPVDTKSGKIFTCFMMPEAEAELEWMQSHHLLNDLELSKDSLNKSMSKSMSSSMPSLFSQSQLEGDSSHDISKGRYAVDTREYLNEKHRSSSTNHVSCVDNVDKSTDLPITPDLSVQKIESRDNDAKSKTKYLSETEMKKRGNLEVTENPAVKDSILFHENHHEASSSKEASNSVSPTQIHIDSSDPTILTDKTWDLSKEKDSNDLEPNGEEFQWATNHEVTPRFYPVRKARNVKLYSHSHQREPYSKSNNNDKPSPITNIRLPLSSPTLSPPLPSAPAELSPALYTSTPKTSKPPRFEDLTGPASPPPRKKSPQYPNTKQKTSVENVRDTFEPEPGYDNCSCESCQVSHLNNDDNIQYSEKNNNNTRYSNVTASQRNVKYGFDSSYRNKVVVDEVDQMKRRRKDRKSKSRSSPPTLSHSDFSQMIPSDIEYYPFEDSALWSPPLATSTMNRKTAGMCERDQCSFSSSRHSKRKAKHKTHDRFSENNNVVNGRGNKNENYDMDVTKNNRLCLSCQECNSSRVATANCIDKRLDNERASFHLGDDNSVDNKDDGERSQNQQLSSNFRRKFNTNSPYFPEEFRINNLPTSVLQPKCLDYNSHNDSFHNINNNIRRLDNNVCIDSRFQDKVFKGISCTNSINLNSKPSQPLTNHFTRNNTEDDRYLTNSFFPSSPQALDNTPNVFTPRKSYDSHHHINNPKTHKDLDHPDQHLRMRIFEDVTHHLANQTQDSQNNSCPSSNASKRKIKFDLPPSDTTSSNGENETHLSSRIHREHPPHSSVGKDGCISKSSLVEATPTRNHTDENTNSSMTQLSPFVNISYSSDW